MLGQEMVKVFGANAVGWDRVDADVTQFKDLRLKIENLRPGYIINCVAYNDVDGAEDNPETARLLNEEVPRELAAIAKDLDIPLVHYSTNYVFDGQKGDYAEDDEPNPISEYGRSKYEGEKAVRKIWKKHYIVRTSVLFGRRGASSQTKRSFVQVMLDLAQATNEVRAVSDEINNTTYVVDLARATKLLLEEKRPYGIYHITNSGQASWYEYAREIFSITNKNIDVVPVPRSEFPRKAQTPKLATLVNTKLPQLRPWQEALREYLTGYGQ